MRCRYVLRKDNLVLLEGFVWIDLVEFARAGAHGRQVLVFRSRARADRARRTYGRPVWRWMEVERVD